MERAVSYTHLDVYKRQHISVEVFTVPQTTEFTIRILESGSNAF